MRRIVLGLTLFGCAATRPSASDVVERELAAYNAQDTNAFAATYAEDATIIRGGTVWLQGRAAIREAYAGMFAKYPNCRARIAERKMASPRLTATRPRADTIPTDTPPTTCSTRSGSTRPISSRGTRASR